MSLKTTTDLGKITINNSVIAKEIVNAGIKVNEKLYFATDRGKLLGKPARVGTSELAANIKVVQNDEKFSLTLYIIMSFGASIKNATETILDTLEHEFKSFFPKQDGSITIKIVGVKSKAIAPRDIEVTREYEASR